jgi:pyruvate kinase
MRGAKIVCTMGPSTLAEGVIERLIEEGMDCARLNFSHGEQAGHLATAQRIRVAAAAVGRHVSILADLQGPKIRVGKFPGGPVDLVDGQQYTLTGEESPCNGERAWVSYELLANDAKPGDLILLDDGLLAMRVREIRGADVVCVVENGGKLSDRKGVNLPGVKTTLPALTPKDIADLKYAVEVVKVDYLALSFVRRAEDVEQAKTLAQGTPLIAKLEKPEALDNLESIVDAADGIMVARGDLGVELGSEKVPMAQKRMIRLANQKRKIVITATQMLDSMIRNPRPTRAEAGDVANAVLDGTDAVMLSGETASGLFPVESVRMMKSLILEAEAASDFAVDPRQLARVSGGWEFTGAAARGAAILTTALQLAAVVVVTSDGQSAGLLSSYRPRCPIIAITDDENAARRLGLRWGVVARVEPPTANLMGSIELARGVLAELFPERTEGAFALVTGFPKGSRTNTVTLQTLRE